MKFSLNRTLYLFLFGCLVAVGVHFMTMEAVKSRLSEKGYEAYWFVTCQTKDKQPFFFEDLHVTLIDQIDKEFVVVDGYDDHGREYKIRGYGWCVLKKPRNLEQ